MFDVSLWLVYSVTGSKDYLNQRCLGWFSRVSFLSLCHPCNGHAFVTAFATCQAARHGPSSQHTSACSNSQLSSVVQCRYLQGVAGLTSQGPSISLEMTKKRDAIYALTLFFRLV